MCANVRVCARARGATNVSRERIEVSPDRVPKTIDEKRRLVYAFFYLFIYFFGKSEYQLIIHANIRAVWIVAENQRPVIKNMNFQSLRLNL